MKNPWIRIQDIANNLGLVCGAIGLIAVGIQFNNNYISCAGLASFLFFATILTINTTLLIRDIKKHKGFKRSFLGIPF